MTSVPPTDQVLPQNLGIIDLQAYPNELRSVLMAADGAGQFVSNTELEMLLTAQQIDTHAFVSVQVLRDHAEPIVAAAKTCLLKRLPDLVEQGGGLFGEGRLAACDRDLWHFLRCVTYGILGDRVPYTSPSGLARMQQLYREKRVPIQGMLVALECLKRSACQVLGDQCRSVERFFDHLQEQLRQF